jgi:hypothetical protein
MILVVRYIPYLLIPTNFTSPWYHGKGLQVIKEVKSLLMREKRVIGLIIIGIVAAITSVATMATAAVALSQSIQNSHYINTLIWNVTYTLQQQMFIYEKIDVHLNTLEVALLTMGDELQTKIQTGPVMSCRLPS